MKKSLIHAFLIGFMLCFGKGLPSAQAQSDEIESSSTIYPIDPHFIPVAEPWINSLSHPLPLFYSGTVDQYTFYGNSISNLGSYLNLKDGVPDGMNYQVGPNALRIKMGTDGHPMVKVTPLIGIGPKQIEVTYELGIFGDDYHAIQVLQAQGVPLTGIRISDATIRPLDTESPEDSLYTNFKDIGWFDNGVVPENNSWVFWTTTVRFTLNTDGLKVLKESLKSGFYSFPIVAVSNLNVAGQPRNNDYTYQLRPGFNRATEIQNITLEIPGGLACLRRGFWGEQRPRTNDECAHYWMPPQNSESIKALNEMIVTNPS